MKRKFSQNKAITTTGRKNFSMLIILCLVIYLPIAKLFDNIPPCICVFARKECVVFVNHPVHTFDDFQL
jgi:hypothetical protein